MPPKRNKDIGIAMFVYVVIGLMFLLVLSAM